MAQQHDHSANRNVRDIFDRPSEAEPPSSGHRPPLDVDKAAHYLNVSPRYVRRLIAERRIRYLKLGRILRFQSEDLDAYLESCRVESQLHQPNLDGVTSVRRGPESGRAHRPATATRRRQFGSIRVLGSGRYQASYWLDGHRLVGTTTFAIKADASAYLATVAADLYRGTWIDPTAGRVALGGYADTWLAERVGIRPRTVEIYQRLLDAQILPVLGSLRLCDLSPSAVRSWHAAIAANHPSTAAKAYRLLATIMGTAVTDELIARSPCRVRGAGIEHPAERPVASIAEVRALVEVMPERMAMIVVLAAWCQLRRGEIFGLRRRDIDFLSGSLRVAQTIQYFRSGGVIIGPPKTVAGTRCVVLPPHTVAALADHLERFVEPSPDALLFVGAKGGPLRPHVLQSAWARARQSVGRPELHLHDLRHAGATWAASTGVSTKELMSRLGHASPRAALIYQHATEPRDHEIARALSKLDDPGDCAEPR